MKDTVELPEDMSRRIDLLAERTKLSRARIVEDALAHGRSLAWQERWIAGIESGLADAEAGAFATDEEITAVLDRFGQV